MRDLIVSTKWVGTYFGKDDFVRDVGYSLDHLFGSNSPSTRSAQGALVIAYDLCTNVIRWIGGEFMHPRTTTKNCGVHIKYVHDWSQVVVAVDRFNFRTSLVLWRKEVSKCSHNSWFFKKNSWYELYNSSVAMDPTAISEHEVASRPQVEDYSRLSGSQTLHFTIKVSDCDPSTEHRQLFLSWAKSASFLARNLSDDCGISAAIHQPWRASTFIVVTVPPGLSLQADCHLEATSRHDLWRRDISFP